MALTFDMGSIRGATLDLLDLLKRENIGGTFFVTGKWVDDNPDLVKAIVADGHGIGNHSYTHPDFTTLQPRQMVEELERTELAVRRAAGVSTRPFWRPPFGAYNDEVMRVVREDGYRVVYWTLDSTDWRDDSTVTSVTAMVNWYAEGGSIIVFHGAVDKTVKALPEIITHMRKKGLRPTSLSDLLASP